MKKVGLVLLFAVSIAYGQPNLYANLELKLCVAKADTQRLEIIKQLVDVAIGSDIEKALEYSRQGVLLADKIEDKNWQPKFYEMEGRMHANLLHLDSVLYYFDKAIKGYKTIKNRRGEATTLKPDGILHLEVSDNGVGKSGITHGTGFGGQLISLLTRQLSSRMSEEIKNGTRVFFDFKLDKVA